ncbi:SAM-dependent methyltransferase [Actinokineospora spheciospongiae]|uniref:SAM-dependent methyltransferase n=1 Tax=Actinokineospora spheciospongiae TaxID=909613 RepID=W7IPM6_9PSEU|nr:methyltransferase domain-containing protein [Actinokineospora spheciospongiae]EWC62353.1 SAM-dependent methyltransferase [Actinokineospora spheciospongiae]
MTDTLDTTGDVGEFTAVDTTADASWFIHFMDLANALPEYVAVRRELITTLGDLTGSTVLDVGCGTGDDARELAEHVGPTGGVLGTDLSEAMVTEARTRSAGSPLPVRFETADMCALPYDDGAFDGVRAKLVRQHCPNLDAADDELVRVIRPGGRLAVFDYDFETLAVDHPDRAATRELVACWVDGHRSGWNGRQLERRFLDRGLREVTVTPHTVRLPFGFFRASLEGKLAQAQASGQLSLSAEDLQSWWKPLFAAQENERFFASLTGFVLGATR